MVDVGCFAPEDIHLPSLYVDRVVKGEKYEKRIEVKNKLFQRLKLLCTQRRTVRKREEGVGMDSGSKGGGASVRERIVRRAALEFKDGMYGILSHPLPVCIYTKPYNTPNSVHIDEAI